MRRERQKRPQLPPQRHWQGETARPWRTQRLAQRACRSAMGKGMRLEREKIVGRRRGSGRALGLRYPGPRWTLRGRLRVRKKPSHWAVHVRQLAPAQWHCESASH